MFIDVSSLKGILVDYDSFKENNIDWNALGKQIKLLLITENIDSVKVEEIDNNNITYHEQPSFVSIVSKELICKWLSEIGLKISEVAYLTCNYNKVKQISIFPIGTIYYGDQPLIRDIPDFFVNKQSDLENIIIGTKKGYLAEVLSLDDHNHKKEYRYCKIKSYQNCGNSQFLLFSTGRYFPKSDARSKQHVLSARIISNKYKDKSQFEIFKLIYNSSVRYIHEELFKIDCIVGVPNKPNSQQYDRFKKIINYVCQNHKEIENIHNQLKCIKAYEKLSKLSQDARYEEVKGAFQIKYNINEKNIVIIDDIYTTGATACEIVKTLRKNGAKKIAFVVLGITQETLCYRNKYAADLICNCSGSYRVKIRGNHNNSFYGCENYTARHRCQGIDYDVGHQKYLDDNNKMFLSNE